MGDFAAKSGGFDFFLGNSDEIVIICGWLRPNAFFVTYRQVWFVCSFLGTGWGILGFGRWVKLPFLIFIDGAIPGRAKIYFAYYRGNLALETRCKIESSLAILPCGRFLNCPRNLVKYHFWFAPVVGICFLNYGKSGDTQHAECRRRTITKKRARYGRGFLLFRIAPTVGMRCVWGPSREVGTSLYKERDTRRR